MTGRERNGTQEAQEAQERERILVPLVLLVFRSLFPARHSRLLFPECSEVDIAMMPSQEIHEPLEIRIGDSEQRQHLPIAAARPFETASNHMLHLRSSDHPLRIWTRYR